MRTIEVFYKVGEMAKRKKRNRTLSKNTYPSGKQAGKSRFATNEQWRPHMPQWLKDIRAAADIGDSKKVKELLDHDKIENQRFCDRLISSYTYRRTNI